MVTAKAAKGTNDLKIDGLLLKKASLVIRAVNHKLRQQILKLIHQQKTITVTEIYVRLRLEQSVASQHLAILRRSGVVITEREGKFIHYAVNYERLKHIQHVVNDMLTD